MFFLKHKFPGIFMLVAVALQQGTGKCGEVNQWIQVVEIRDPYSGVKGLTAFLEERGIPYLDVLKKKKWNPGGCKVLWIGSFATASSQKVARFELGHNQAIHPARGRGC